MIASAQLGLFGREVISIDESFCGLVRTELGQGGWFEHAPGWLSGHELLFERLRHEVTWHSSRREMYERTVDVPRLHAVLPDDGPIPASVENMRAALTHRYGERFERVSLAYYRDGRDSVAFHGDRVARELETALVATVSLGTPRPFLIRTKGAGRSLVLRLGWGDLLVMGGSAQRTAEHAVPKQRHAEPRIAIMFRPRWLED